MLDGPRLWFAVVLLASSALCSSLLAQPPGARPSQRKGAPRKAVAEKQPQLPSDPQLLSLHKEFVVKAEKLATEYERRKQYAQAREVYESLVRLVPNYGSAEAGLKRALNSQSRDAKKIAEVQANGQWQYSGAMLRQGMPVHIETKGTWKVVYETGPKGIEIPNDFKLRDNRIKLGSLIAVVVSSSAELADAKPFAVRDGDDFIAKKSGRLYLRMYDVDPTDNEGKLYVLIQSTFYK